MLQGLVISCCLYTVRPDRARQYKDKTRQSLHHSITPSLQDPAAMNGTFLITGAAGGFGKEFSRRVLEGGGRVVLTDKNLEAGTELCQAFQQVPSLHDNLINIPSPVSPRGLERIPAYLRSTTSLTRFSGSRSGPRRKSFSSKRSMFSSTMPGSPPCLALISA